MPRPKTNAPKQPDWDADDTEAAGEPEAAPPAAGMVRVKCVSRNEPWTDTKKLAFGEVVNVPADVAKLMEAREQVLIL